METNFLTQKQKNFVLELSREIKAQDNLRTASPYIIINTQNRVQVRPDTHASEYLLYLDFETKIYNNDEIIEFVKDDYPILTEWLEDNLCELREIIELEIDDGLKRVKSEYEEFLSDYSDISIIYYEEELESSKNDISVFFTHKAYEKHIEANLHHYNEPKSYVKGLFRNPEMEGVLDVIHTLAHAIEIEDENEKVCLFKQNGEGAERAGHYRTGCGELFFTVHGSIGKGSAEKFCPYCGSRIEEV